MAVVRNKILEVRGEIRGENEINGALRSQMDLFRVIREGYG